MPTQKRKKIIMTINESQDEIISQFQDFTDWMDKYQLLIDIDGCQSRVWIQCDITADGRLVFTADSDALIVKGIIALLIQILSNHTPKEILDADLYFIDAIGLGDHLSPTRANGLLAMVKRIKAYAVGYEIKG